jgi:hypothetical protein
LWGALASVDADARTAVTAAGERLYYDALLVAVGAGSEPAFRRVLTWTPELVVGSQSGLRSPRWCRHRRYSALQTTLISLGFQPGRSITTEFTQSGCANAAAVIVFTVGLDKL